MKLEIPKKIHRKQWLRRMGVRGEGDERLAAAMDKWEPFMRR